MLPKHKRLNLKTNFKWVASGKRFETKNFKVFVKNGENFEPLVGVAVSTSVFKKSTLRNKAKRISFKVAEKAYPHLRKNTNLVIMPKTGVLETPIKDLEDELKSIRFLYE